MHRDLKKPFDQQGFYFGNILLTATGLRLVDVGISAIRDQAGARIFFKYIEQEKDEAMLFRDYSVNR